MYRTTQAAKYVGMKFTTFTYHIQEGHLKEDYRIKGERVFRKETLDAFKIKHIADANRGMTKEQIASVYGQEIPVVRGQLRRKKIEPIAKNSKRHIYSVSDIEKLAAQLDWKKQALDVETDTISA